MEDDADWDIRIRQQLSEFATASHALTQPLRGHTETFAGPTYPSPKSDDANRVTTFDLHNLPPTQVPTSSPYGDNWDLLWLGHCGMHFPFADDTTRPKGRVVWTDHTVPQQQYLWTISNPDDLREEYPDHTRVAHRE